MKKQIQSTRWKACMVLALSIVFSGSNYAQVLPTFATDLAKNSSQLATANNTLKSLSSTTISPQDLQTIDSLILNEATVLRNKFYLLAGWLNRKAALQAVPYEYRRNLRDQNDYDMAMIRLGDQSRIKRLNKLLASVQVDDDFVYTLLPKLIYTRRPEVIDFIFDQVLLDQKNCSVADPHTKGRINCAYRLLEAVAPVVNDFPLKLGPGGDLDVTDYPAALEIARTWIRDNRNDYRIISETY